MATAVTRSIVCPVLIGRQSHLDALVQFIEQARSGHGQTVLVSGEAGIGKSRLVAEAIKHARTAQAHVGTPGTLMLAGRCFEPDRSLPYAPLLDVLRSLLATHSSEDMTALLRPMAPELVKLLPELATLLPALVPGPLLEPEQEKRQLFSALTNFFTHLSAMQPLLIVIEDVHWSDDNSLEFLLSLARRIASHHILLLLTYRSEDEVPVLMPFITTLNRERLAVEVTLTALTIDEVGEMIGAILHWGGPAPQDAIDRVPTRRPIGGKADFLEAIDAISRLTEGNPFFIEEMLKSLVTSGEILYADGKWERKPQQDEQGLPLPERLQLPRSVQLAVQQRLDHVSVEARELLSLAAVAGRRFDFALLQQVTGRNEVELVRLLKEMMAAQMVVEEAEDVFAFRHALTRQAVYTDLLARERRALHRVVAETLESMHANTLDAHLGDLAYHFYMAREWSKVLAYALRAGKQAQGFYAHHAAIEQYTHVLEAAQHLSHTPLVSVYLARGQCYDVVGDFQSACADYLRALEAARAAQDRDGEWQSLFALGYLWTGREYAQAGRYLQQALSLARSMHDPLVLSRTLNRLGNWYVHTEQPQEGLRYHQEALDYFSTLGEERGMAETFDLMGTAATNSGSGPITGMEYYERAIALYRRLEERQGLISSLVMLALRGTNYMGTTTVWSITSGSACIRDAEEGLALSRQIGWRSGEALALCVLGMILGPRGEYTRALACAQASLDSATEVEHGPWTILARLLLGILFTDLLAFEAARAHLEQALALAKGSGSLFLHRITTAFLASTCMAQQDLVHAEAILTPAADLTTPPQTVAQRLCWAVQVELALAREHPSTALSLLDQLLATKVNGEEGNNGVIPRLWHLRAQALMALKRAEEAESVLREAQAEAELHQARPFLWRICLTLGKLARTRDQRNQATAYFAQARAIIEELAASLPEGPLRETFLRSATAQLPRLTQPSPRRTAMQAFGGLTERERGVAELIAQGKSNRIIADELVVSERTVGTHVENILSKLGFTSRAQIAVWAVEKGLAKQ